MTHSHRKAKSRFEYFRMDVPARHRATVGKTSWQHSLETTDPQIAAIKRAEWTAFYKAEVKRLDDRITQSVILEAGGVVDGALEAMAARNGSLDNVMVALLILLAMDLRRSWGIDHARKLEQWLIGLPTTVDEDELPPAMPVFVTDAERDQFVVQSEIFELRQQTNGFAHQQVAKRLLAQESWASAETILMAVSGHSGELYDAGTPRYNAIAKHLLQRLADHRFSHWPEKLAEAIAPLAARQPALGLPATSPILQAQQPPAALIAAGHPISEVFAEWRQASKAREKSKDEFGAAIRQFIDLFGDIAVELITRSIVKQFRKALLQRPTRPSPEIRALPLREQIAIATAQNLPTVSPKSAKKALQGLKSVLAYAVEEDYIEADPSAKISIDADVGFDDERLPFDETQLRRIYSQPTLIDPDVDDDVIFWFFVLAPLTGARGEELAQLRPGNIRVENGVWFIAIYTHIARLA